MIPGLSSDLLNGLRAGGRPVRPPKPAAQWSAAGSPRRPAHLSPVTSVPTPPRLRRDSAESPLGLSTTSPLCLRCDSIASPLLLRCVSAASPSLLCRVSAVSASPSQPRLRCDSAVSLLRLRRVSCLFLCAAVPFRFTPRSRASSDVLLGEGRHSPPGFLTPALYGR